MGVGARLSDVLPPSRHLFHTLLGIVNLEERCLEIREWLCIVKEIQQDLQRNYPEESGNALMDCFEHNLRHIAHADR